MSDILCYFMRHGETKLNNKDEFRGWSDDKEASLTPEGAKSILESAEWLCRYKIPIDTLVCSDLERVIQSAEIVAKKFAIAEITTMKNWRTLNIGEWEGTPKADHDLIPYFLNKNKKIPGGESLLECENRFVEALIDTMDIIKEGKNVLVVTSGTACGFVYGMQNLGEHLYEHYEGPVEPSGIMELRMDSAIPLTSPREINLHS